MRETQINFADRGIIIRENEYWLYNEQNGVRIENRMSNLEWRVIGLECINEE